MCASSVEEIKGKELEIFSDRLTDVVAKIEDSDRYQERVGVSALYIAVQQKLPESLLIVSKSGCSGSPGRLDRGKLFVAWMSKKLRSEQGKRKRLNDAMLIGQRDVLEILLQFRLRRVDLEADIKEMFSQVAVS